MSVAAAGRGWIFPGQGARLQAAERELFEVSAVHRTLLARGSDITGRDLRALVLSGTTEEPLDTVTSQLRVFAYSTALALRLRDAGCVPAVVAGHSLGEFSALAAGGWLEVEAALDAVAHRAMAMHEACQATDGAMTAIVGLAADRVADVVAAAAPDVALANHNSPTQLVVSGPRVGVEAVASAMRESGAQAALPLRVAGAFHSVLMAPARDAFAARVASLPLTVGRIAMVSSIDGGPVADLDDYRQLLATQICAPVRWDLAAATVARLAPGGVLEVGPGRTLRGLMREAAPGVEVALCGTVADCDRWASELARVVVAHEDDSATGVAETDRTA